MVAEGRRNVCEGPSRSWNVSGETGLERLFTLLVDGAHRRRVKGSSLGGGRPSKVREGPCRAWHQCGQGLECLFALLVEGLAEVL